MSRARLVLPAIAISALAAAGLAGAAGTANAAAARPSCISDTDGDCWHPNYQVWRTDGSLDIWTAPNGWTGAYDTGQSVGGNGARVEVDCQAEGAPVDGLPYTVWDRLDDGSWVYDYYITTPGDGYHLGQVPGVRSYPSC